MLLLGPVLLSIMMFPISLSVVGVPGRQIGWMSRFGEQLNLEPLEGSGEVSCDHTGERYKLIDGRVVLERRIKGFASALFSVSTTMPLFSDHLQVIFIFAIW